MMLWLKLHSTVCYKAAASHDPALARHQLHRQQTVPQAVPCSLLEAVQGGTLLIHSHQQHAA